MFFSNFMDIEHRCESPANPFRDGYLYGIIIYDLCEGPSYQSYLICFCVRQIQTPWERVREEANG